MDEGNANLIYSSPWDFKSSLTCRKLLRHGTSGFTSYPKEGELRIFIAVKNPSPLAGFEPAIFESSGKHTTTPRRLFAMLIHRLLYKLLSGITFDKCA
jgi:hypothetical protein